MDIHTRVAVNAADPPAGPVAEVDNKRRATDRHRVARRLVYRRVLRPVCGTVRDISAIRRFP